ncbi:hypothetical protein AB0P15_21570 [Streptomyces sp. NPDC087917]|uniref:hypothetical protein n=1 Tax=Streptomyces sp. NPDC087917 TaxID=3155060 RepID=UPI0034352DD9
MSAAPDAERLTHAVDPAPRPAALGHHLNLAAETDGSGARELARALAGSLSPEARLVLRNALDDAEADAGDDAGHYAAGDSDVPPVRRNDPPDALVRLRFADATTLERAAVAFGGGSRSGLGDAWSDPTTLTLQIAGDARVETLRAVLAVLDAAAITSESLTVHTRELDDVLAVFTGMP